MRRASAALGCGVIVVAGIFAACSSQRSTPGGASGGTPGGDGVGALPGPATGDVGNVHAQLLIGSGVQVTSLGWTIQGPKSYAGTVAIGDAQSVEFVAGGIQAGGGYTLTLSGSDSAGDSCNGTSTSFSVLAGQVTEVILNVVCTVPPDGGNAADVGAGSVEVDAAVTLVSGPPTICPGISSIAANPAELAPGQASQLGLATTAPASIQWTVSPANGGTFVNPADGGAGSSLAAPQFLCSTPNSQVTITATIGLPDSGACAGQSFTSYSFLVNCEPACATAADCPGSSTACLARTCITGRCGTATTAEGTTCDSAGDVCDGIGNCIPFTFSVVRIGTGDAGTLTTAAAPVFIQKRLVADGGIVGTPVLLPTASPGAGQDMLTMPGIALIAGLSRSQDGRYLTLAGYNAPVGNSNPANSSSAIVVARIDANGNVDTSTQFSSTSHAFLSLNSLRTSVTADGTSFWVGGLGATVDGGSTGGIWAIPFGIVDGTQLSAVPTRLLGVASSQLYGSGETDGGGAEVFTVGTGLPTSGSPSLAGLPGLPMVTSTTASPWQFVFVQMNTASSGFDTLYVANDRAVGGISTGVQRFTLSGGTWTQTATLMFSPADGGAPVGFRGLAGVKTGASQVTLIATSVENPTRIMVFTDDGVSSPWNGTSRVVATGNGLQEVFRGVALSPHP